MIRLWSVALLLAFGSVLPAQRKSGYDLSPELVVQKGHINNVNSVSWSPDGKRLATASQDKAAIVWEAATGKQLLALEGHTSVVTSVRWSPDGKHLATASWDKTAIVWEVATGKQLLTLKGHTRWVQSVRWSPDGKHLATASWDETAIVWETATGKQLLALEGHTSGVESVCWSPDGKHLATASVDKTAIVWEAATGKQLFTLQGHTNSVWSVSWSPDGKHLATASQDKTAIVWEVATGKQLLTLGGHTSDVESVSWSPDGMHLATASWDKTAIVWEVATGKQLLTLQEHTNSVTSVSWSPDGKHLATASDDKTAIVWETATGKQLLTLQGHTARVFSVSWSPDGKHIATASSDKTAIVWETATGKNLLTLRGHTKSVNSVSWSPDGKHLATTSSDNTAIVWESITGKKLLTLQGHTSTVKSVNWFPDDKHLATASMDGTIGIWDAQTGSLLAKHLSLDAGKNWLVVTPDGYFDGSPAAAQFVEYRVPGTLDLVPLENYRKQFERPGLLAKILRGEDYRGSNTVVQDLPPKVRITSPGDKHTSRDGKFTITAEGESRGRYPVEEFRLLVNGRPYPVRPLFRVTQPKLGKATAKWEIQLEPGRHSVEVLAYTRAVYHSSESIEIRYGGSSSTVALPKLYVLAVGISDYHSENLQDLDFAHRDAEEVAQAFSQHSKPLFSKIETKVLTNKDATKLRILKELNWLRRSVTQNDFAVFFFAGHGKKDERDAVYFLPHDADKDLLVATAIDGDILSKELESTVGQLTVILDACHSGALGDKNKTRGLTDNLLRDLTSKEKGIAMMCSATGAEEARESRTHRHGVFTVALLEAIRGTGNGESGPNTLKVNKFDGAVYFNHVNSYVSDRVKQLTKGYQHPQTVVPRSFRDFPLSKP